MRGAFVLLVALGVASAGPIYPESLPPQQHVSSEVKVALIKKSHFERFQIQIPWTFFSCSLQDLQNEILKAAALKAAAESIKLEQAAEDEIIEAAVETLKEEPSPEHTEHLKQMEKLLKRDKRAVQLLQGLLGGSSGGGGGGGVDDEGGGSDSGAIFDLVGPIISSSSGGGGGGDDEDGEGGGGGGSDIQALLALVSPIISSSSGGGGEEGKGSSDLQTIIDLVGPVIGEVSGGDEEDGGGGGSSNLRPIIDLIGPLSS
ncbi:unnamed protein product, partial [Nesidiocoris tenuis]